MAVAVAVAVDIKKVATLESLGIAHHKPQSWSVRWKGSWRDKRCTTTTPTSTASLAVSVSSSSGGENGENGSVSFSFSFSSLPIAVEQQRHDVLAAPAAGGVGFASARTLYQTSALPSR